MFLQFLRLDGKAFHTVGAAWKKARLPKVFRVTLGITRTENLKNHTLFRGTYLYSPYMRVPPRLVHWITGCYFLQRLGPSRADKGLRDGLNFIRLLRSQASLRVVLRCVRCVLHAIASTVLSFSKQTRARSYVI